MRVFLRSLLVAAAILVAGPLLAQEGTPIVPTATEADYAAVVDKSVRGYIVPAFRDLDDRSEALAGTLHDFCYAGGNRDEVQAAFAATVRAWAKVDFLRFGPMAQGNRYERYAFFPDVHGTGARQLRQFLAGKDEKLLAPGTLARQSAAVQGLPALESLLYASPSLLFSEIPEEFRCRLALAVADNMAAIAAEALAAWTEPGGWAELMGSPDAANPVYRTHAEAMTEIVRGVLTGLEQVKDHRLLPALGATPAEARASRAPYTRSGEALPYLTASAEALRDFTETSGVLDLLPPDQRWIAAAVRFEFGNLGRALAAAGPDLAAAVKDPELRGKLSYAVVVLLSLRELFQVRLTPAAGLTAGFNALDGD